MRRDIILRSQLDNFDDNDEYGLECLDPSLAVQSEADEADINTIVRRFGLTGQLPTNVRVPLQEDFIDIISYQDAMNAMRAAQQSFAAMPADVRRRFNDNPGDFVDFCSEVKDGKLANIEEMRKLGLAVDALPAGKLPVVPSDGSGNAPGGSAGAG